MASKVPSGWQLKPIRNLISEDRSGAWGDSPIGSGGVGVIRSTNFNDDATLDFTKVACRHFSERDLEKLVLRVGDIILERSGGGPDQPIGRVAIFAHKGIFVCSNFTQRLRAASEVCLPDFLPYLLWHFHWIGGTLRLQQRTSGIRNLAYEQYLSTELLLPSIPEQRAIAAILQAADNAVIQTRAEIQQTRRVKVALLDNLISRGLPRKKTKFRKIRLGEVFQERKERGRPGLPIMAVTMNDGLVERTSLDRRMETSLEAKSHLLARKGDIGYNMMRMWQGVFGLAQRDCLISPAYVVVTPLAGIVPEYAAYLFKHPAVIRKFHLFSQGLTDDRLRLYFDQFKTITLQLVADEDEQRKIAATLQAVDDRIETLIAYSERLSCVKQALSHVLLTGKKRVQPAIGKVASGRSKKWSKR